MFGCFLSGDDCVGWRIIRIVDTKDMVSAIGSPYHSEVIALDALLFVIPSASADHQSLVLLPQPPERRSIAISPSIDGLNQI